MKGLAFSVLFVLGYIFHRYYLSIPEPPKVTYTHTSSADFCVWPEGEKDLTRYYCQNGVSIDARTGKPYQPRK